MNRISIRDHISNLQKKSAPSKLLAIAISGFLAGATASSQAATLGELLERPLFYMGGMEYLGGFRLPKTTNGSSNASYAQGPIGLGKDGLSMYIAGHKQQQAIAEFAIPELVNSKNHTDFNTATFIQPFFSPLNKAETGNPDNINALGGIGYIDGRLFVNGVEYYDADSAARDTTLVIEDASNLSGSKITGYHEFSSKAKAAGWITPIPPEWVEHLGGTYIAGNSSGIPIINRTSVGPSFYSFNPVAPNASPQTINTKMFLEFDLEDPLGMEDGADKGEYLNGKISNKIWNHLTRAVYGFIVPGTRTYLTIGYSGGMDSGIGYKLPGCGGYCPVNYNDQYTFYWLWDMKDLIDISNGADPSDLMPYSYGRLDLSEYNITDYEVTYGATFDYSKGILYLNIKYADQLTYVWLPLILAFQLDVVSPPEKIDESSIQIKVLN